MKKPSPIQVVCIIQLVVAAWWAVVVSFGSPARGTIINLVFLACAALAGLQAATSSAARKIAIGLNVFEVLVWAGSLPPAIRAVSTAGKINSASHYFLRRYRQPVLALSGERERRPAYAKGGYGLASKSG